MKSPNPVSPYLLGSLHFGVINFWNFGSFAISFYSRYVNPCQLNTTFYLMKGQFYIF